MADSIDIFLKAWDQTAPAINSSIGNFERFSRAAANANSAAMEGVGSSFLDKLTSWPVLVGAATVATGAFATAVATNFKGIGDAVANGFNRATDATVSFTKDTGDLVKRGLSGAADLVTGSYLKAITKLGTVSVDVYEKMSGKSIDWTKVLSSVVTAGVKGIGTLEFAFKNWADVGALAIIGLERRLVKFKDEAVHIFTKTLPDAMIATWDNPQGAKSAGKFLLPALAENPLIAAATPLGILDQLGWLPKPTDKDAFAAVDFFGKIRMDAPVSPQQDKLNREWDELNKKLQGSLTDHLKTWEAKIPNILASLYEGAGSVGNFFSNLFKDFSLSDTLAAMFGGEKIPSPQFAMPKLGMDRHTTGVRESREEELMLQAVRQQAEQAKRQTEILEKLARACGIDLPDSVAKGIRQALPAAGAAMGFPLPPLR